MTRRERMGPETEGVDPTPPPEGAIRGFRLLVLAGPAKGVELESTGERCSIGSDPANALVIEDPTVSRFHCEITTGPREIRVRDLGSTNGTIVDGVRINDAFLRAGSALVLGRSVVSFELGGMHHELAVSSQTRFGSLVGASV